MGDEGQSDNGTAPAPPAGAPGSEDGADAAVDHRSGIGVCVSGGGIRAAAFGLGALQTLDGSGTLRAADYLAAVSGGSYIVGAMMLVERGPFTTDERAEDGRAVVAPTTEMPAFSHGSPEEQYLRSHLDYLTSGPGGLVAVLVRATYGLLLNVLFLGITVWVPALLLGWFYGWRISGLRYKMGCSSTTHCSAGFHASGWEWAVAGVIGGLGILCGLFWVGIPIRRRSRRQTVGMVSGALVLLAAGVLLFAIAFPYLLEYLRGNLAHSSAAAAGTIKGQSTATTHSTAPLAVGTFVGLGGLLTTTAGLLRHVISSPTASEKLVEGRVGKFAQKHRGLLLSIGAAISVPLFALVSVVLAINWGAAHPPFASGAGSPLSDLAWGVPPLVLWWVLVFVADVNAWSLHPYYKQHLSLAFALARTADQQGAAHAAERANETPYKLSKSQPANFPKFLICATANINDRDKVPTGFRALPFIFAADMVGSDGVGWQRTSEYEKLAEYRVTVPTAMAISGAALSPEMGAMTRRPLRMLMTLANIRLGVWLPTPGRPRPPKHTLRRAYFRAPRPYYLFAELFGWTRLRSRYLCVTDGGHYDNLGLVELMRRRCTTLFCIDASGEAVNSFGTIGNALAIARAEALIADFNLDPRRDLAPSPDAPRFVRSSYCIGTVTYPGGTVANIVIVKAGVTANAPWDVRAFHERDATFPCDTTLDQFYTAPRFDAYRALGEFSMKCALEGLKSQPWFATVTDPVDLREGRRADAGAAPGGGHGPEPAEGGHVPEPAGSGPPA